MNIMQIILDNKCCQRQRRKDISEIVIVSVEFLKFKIINMSINLTPVYIKEMHSLWEIGLCSHVHDNNNLSNQENETGRVLTNCTYSGLRVYC